MRTTLPDATSTTLHGLAESARYKRFPSAVQCQADHGLRELDRAAARLARRGVPEPEARSRPRFVIGQKSLAVGAELGNSPANTPSLGTETESRREVASQRRRVPSLRPWPAACRPD